VVKRGVDRDLEEQADKLLRDSAGKNKRGIARDAEKMAYERGFLSREELAYYDPANDWDTHDEPVVTVVSPDDLAYVTPTICAEVDDGNVRRRNARSAARRALARHVEDTDSWGGTAEDVPLLGANDGPRKVCTRCKQAKGLSLFSPKADSKDGLHPWCKECRKGFVSQKRRRAG
jgi:hypothetical protein